MNLHVIYSKPKVLSILTMSLASLIYCMGPLNASAQQTSIDEITNFRTYESIPFGLRMLYPSDWSVTEVKSTLSQNASVTAVAFFKAPMESPSDMYQENVILNMKGPSPDDLTLSDYTANSLGIFRNMPTIRLLQSFPNTFAGLPAHMIVYSENSQGLDIQKMQIWTVVNNSTAYVVTFGAEQTQFGRYLPAVEQMINSIQINKPAAISAGIPQ